MATRPPSRSIDSQRVGLTQRRASQARREAAAQSLQRFVRQAYWNGLSTGDVVRVAGHPARGRHWRFRAHVTNTSNGASWVEVALVEGPPPARSPKTTGAVPPGSEASAAPESMARVEKIRSIDPALVTPRWASRRRSRSQGQPPPEAEHRSELPADVADDSEPESGRQISPAPPATFRQHSLF